jgi:hypothetical protein
MDDSGDFQVKGWTFAQAPIWLLCDQRLSAPAKVLALYLVYRQRSNAACWPAIPRMAHDLSVSADTVRRRCRELQQAGYLKVTPRSGRSNLYTLSAIPSKPPQLAPKLLDELGMVMGTTPGIFAGGEAGTPRRSARGPLARMQGSPGKSATHKDRQERHPSGKDKDPIWKEVLAELQMQLTKATFDTWVQPTDGRQVDGHWEITCHNDYARDWLENRLATTIHRTLVGVVGENVGDLVFKLQEQP